MAKVHEHKVGSTFVRHGLIYQVMEGDHCFGCAFMNEDENVCMMYAQTGRSEICSPNIRKDGKNVIYVQVGEVPESE